MDIISDAIPEILGAFIGSLTTFFAFYLQAKKEREKTLEANKSEREKILEASKNEREKILEANKLQWLKELIITPNISKIYTFFDEIEKQARYLRKPEADKIAIDDHIKELRQIFTRDFIEMLQITQDSAIPNMGYKDAKENLEILQDDITNAMYDDSIDLTDRLQYEKFISNKISDTKNATIKAICKCFSV